MNLRATGAAFKQQAIHFFADPQWIIPSIIAPFIFTVVVLFMNGSGDGPAVLQAVLGGGVLGMWGNTIFASGYSVSYDRYNGTVDPIMVSSSSLMDVVAGRCLWNTIIGLINALLVFVVAELMFQAPMSIENPLMFFAVLLLTLGSLSSIGMIFSACFVWTRASSALFAVLEFPIYILSGAMIPLTMLGGFQYVSYILPPTWGVDALKKSALGTYEGMMGTTMAESILVMAVLMVVYLLVALMMFKVIERNVRVTGSMTRY